MITKLKNMKKTRRKFIKRSGQFALGLGFIGLNACSGGHSHAEGEGHDHDSDHDEGHDEKKGHDHDHDGTAELFFKISLAQWSLHKSLGIRSTATMDHLDFVAKAKNDFGIEAVEYVNQFFKDKAKDMAYLKEMNKRVDDHGVKQLIIMIDGEGGLADTDQKKRKQAVENHYKWVDAAKFLGCHSIRVNSYGEGAKEEVAKAAIDGLGSLAEFAAKSNINVIVENHGGYSSDGQWLAGVMKQINLPNCGT